MERSAARGEAESNSPSPESTSQETQEEPEPLRLPAPAIHVEPGSFERILLCPGWRRNHPEKQTRAQPLLLAALPGCGWDRPHQQPRCLPYPQRWQSTPWERAGGSAFGPAQTPAQGGCSQAAAASLLDPTASSRGTCSRFQLPFR